jgi:hypothetical protein
MDEQPQTRHVKDAKFRISNEQTAPPPARDYQTRMEKLRCLGSILTCGRGDRVARDNDGPELESLDAECKATRAAAGIGHENLPNRRCSEIGVQVRDEHG